VGDPFIYVLVLVPLISVPALLAAEAGKLASWVSFTALIVPLSIAGIWTGAALGCPLYV
jgi:hypothetical protein